ncbi:family 2 glycosyl transferase [Kalymmatonema gypsitolerans NIES-4073]|nr:family 2 glycosyl transferase [Scytonema sp. NIES-4073]
MHEQNLYREIITPVPDGVTRPLWSVMIPTYNCANYLRETLAGILAQDLGPEVMQIEVVDDHSTQDDPAAIVEELGRGRVSFYRQPENVGAIKNFNTCLQRSRGHLVHLLHGDDCVRDGFYWKMQRAFDEKAEIGAAFCRHIFIDGNSHWLFLSDLEQSESGILSNWLERIAVMNLLQPPSIVVRRDVYEKLGGFDSRICCCAEDWEMWVRIAADYPVWYDVEPLALYRFHSASLTGRCARTGQNVRDLCKIIEIIQPYLPAPIAKDLSRKSRENWALYAIKDITPQMFAVGDLSAVTTQIQEALRCSCSLNIIKELTPLVLQLGKLWLKKTVNTAARG